MRKILTFVIMLFASVVVNVHANSDLEEVKANLPKMFGASNVGMEFYLTFFPAWEISDSGNFIKIFFSSMVDTRVKIEVVGIGFEKSIEVKAGEVTEFNMMPDDAMPYRRNDREKPLAEQVFKGRGIHISAEDPIIVYGMTRYQYSSDGYLALPLYCLGNKYMVASYMDTDGASQYLSSYTGIVSAYDANEIEFTLGGSETSKTAGGMKYGETKPFSMNSSDLVLIGSIGKYSDLTGSVIAGMKPVAVVSGNFCVYIPQDKGYCDYIIEMEIPAEIWGYSYNISPIYGRKRPGIIKIFAKEMFTHVFHGGEEIGFIKIPGGREGEGWLEMRASEITKDPEPVNIRGDKPINVVYYNTSSRDDNVESDPFQMNILAERHYSKYYEFIIPGVNGGESFNRNYVNIVYRATESGELPDEMYFGKYIDGSVSWDRLKDISSDPGRLISGTENDKRSYYTKTMSIDSVSSPIIIKSNEAFGVHIYGQDDTDDSYGYLAGGVFMNTNVYDTKAPILINEEGSGLRIRGEFKDIAGEGEEVSGMRILFLIRTESYNYNFSRNGWSWELNVIDENKAAKAVLYACDMVGNDITVEYLYSPYGLIASYEKLEFKNCVAGNNYEKSVNLQNISDEVIEIKSMVLEKGSNFSIVSDLIGQIGANSQTDIRIKFNAGSKPWYSDNLIVNYGDNRELWVSLLGDIKIMSAAASESRDAVYIYPNPVRGEEFKVYLADSGALEFSIYNLRGNVIKSGKTGSDSIFKVSISDLQSGSYVLILKNKYGIVGTESFAVVK